MNNININQVDFQVWKDSESKDGDSGMMFFFLICQDKLIYKNNMTLKEHGAMKKDISLLPILRANQRKIKKIVLTAQGSEEAQTRNGEKFIIYLEPELIHCLESDRESAKTIIIILWVRRQGGERRQVLTINSIFHSFHFYHGCLRIVCLCLPRFSASLVNIF